MNIPLNVAGFIPKSARIAPIAPHFDQTRQTCVVFHMMSALGELGRTGLTAVGNSHGDAKATYERAVAVLDEETRDERDSLKR
jgi:hypothetical protein